MAANYTRRLLGATLVALLAVGGAHALHAQQQAAPNTQQQGPTGPPRDDSSLSHSRGQSIIPVYNGWHPNTDGTFDLWFGYLSDNWRQELDMPVGANNNISAPFGPDAGQPTHFFPRNNRYQFKIRVPADFGKKEIIWTLTTAGRTYRAYATLDPSYVRDDFGLSREYWGEAPPSGNDAPEITLEGPATRRLKVGEYSDIVYTIKDDGKTGRTQGGAAAQQASNRRPGANAGGGGGGRQRPSICGAQAGNAFYCGEPNEGAGALSSVKGLRSSCFVHRGDPEIKTTASADLGQAGLVHFDPPQEAIFEDHRGASPWAAGYVLPELPKDNKWTVHASFSQPGTFVVRCQAHDGLLRTWQDITFEVTP